ncbi:MAG: AraC family transcriptional regulator [Propionibacteriaceae bacterium]|nr:MAG: AraC family transcriptional regulator [Propionibacteriaceae bacterium]
MRTRGTDPQRTTARRLIGSPPARELVPTVATTSARWHIHDYPGPYCRWHHHPELEIHLIQHSTGHSIVGDHIGRFAPGSLFLVGSDLPHHWISDLPAGGHLVDRDVVFQFHPQWLRECRGVLPELAALDGLMERSARGIEFVGETAVEAAAELVAIGASSGVARVQHILSVLSILDAAPVSEARQLASPWTPGREGVGSADVIDKTLAYIFDHVSDDIRLAEAADLAGMSESGFSRYFQRASGQSFTDTVRKLRLTHACHLLEQTDAPVATISRRVGYRNLSNFNRQFRATYSVTPREHRRRHARS